MSYAGLDHAAGAFGALRAGAQPEGFDLYPAYHALRAHSPVWHSPWGDWYLTSSQAVSDAFLDPACSRLPPDEIRTAPVDNMIASYFRDWALYLDGPVHTRLRMDMSRALTPARIDALQRVIESTCRSLLARQAGERTEIVSALTQPLPVLVISRLLGTPPGDALLIRQWAVLLRGVLDGAAPGDDQLKTMDQMWDYFRRLVADPAWRAGPAAQSLSDLVASFPVDVVAANLAMLAFAGHETTVHLMSSMLLLLAGRPAQWQQLRGRPDLAPAAVTEALRLESPVQKICRWTHAQTTIDGVKVPAHQLLVLMLGAANRDPAQFSRPDEFDIDRDQRANIGFGRGTHLCLGRSLALLEATTVLQVLLQTWESVELGPGGAQWLNNSSFRGLRQLELRWRTKREPG